MSRWESSFDEDLVPVPEERQRRSGGVEEGLVKVVLEAYDKFNPQRKRYKLKTFLRYLKKEYRQELLSYPVGKTRKTITEILEAHGFYQRKRRKQEHDPGGAKIERFYPGAQTGVDGKEMKISLENEEHTFNLEMAQDLASQKVTSFKVTEAENTDAVSEVVRSTEESHGAPLAILSDNGKANKAARSATSSDWDHTFPYHPKTNGTLEGEFSKLESVIGSVKIAGDTAKERAKNILQELVGVYVSLRNAIPRCSKCPFTPDELMNYQPTPGETKHAWNILTARRIQREKDRVKNIDPEKHALCEKIIQRHRLHLYCSPEEYICRLSRFDKAALLKADEEFSVYSQRDSFDEGKRHGNYFYAIVKAKQQEKDDARRKEHLRERFVFEQKKEHERKEEQFKRSEQEARMLKEKNPVDYVIKWMKTGFLLKDPVLREKFSVYKEKVRDGLLRILNLKGCKKILQRLQEELMSCIEFSLESRKEMIHYINSEMAILQQTG